MSPQGITPRRGSHSRSPSASQASSGSRSLPHSQTMAYLESTRSQSGGKQAQRFSKKSKKTRKVPVKKIVITSLLVVVLLFALGLVVDLIANNGKVHRGVTVQGVDIGGMTREQAVEVLAEQIEVKIAGAPVDLFASEELLSRGVNEETVELDHASTTYSGGTDMLFARSWRISEATVGATFDPVALAEDAYEVGRGMGFLLDRLKANLFGVDLSAELSFDPSHIEALESLLSGSLGQEVRNADIALVDGSFLVVPGGSGIGVNHEHFCFLLAKAFFSEKRGIVVPLSAKAVEISDEEAQALADKVAKAIEQPVILEYDGEDFWSIEPSSLGTWIKTTIEGKGEDAKLVPFISKDLLKRDFHDIIGDLDPGIPPQNARFAVVNNKITIVPGVNGSGVDYEKVASDLGDILFHERVAIKERRIMLSVTDLEPSFNVEDAKAMGINDLIASYTTEYLWSSNAKVHNIHLACDLINNTFIESGGIWSFHETAGNCTAERGFQMATAIVQGEYVDEIGGGICQVATTIFNAVYESGLPIVERVNHGFYLIAYPAGRDATVSWRWPDLRFENETDSWILMTMSYTDTTVTCMLWGRDPGYRVESEDTGFLDRTDFETKKVDNPDLPRGEERVKQEGVRGRTIVVTRYVYNSTGELVRKTDFKSVYAPEPEIIEVGTKVGGSPGGSSTSG